ncbi:hypothetical protein Oscil6304_5336 [Oscillatoria acuminata PCC 6304]|uniref:Uncharacterized protein n=1 Tax=Oscillatoria acuminata PCC 6304 TaxID=56110 RepID=K9TQK8_9CYAN|nr:hypothetical protein Oscil6304_5336 [Oscillatoria acuminata PCC 6304]
MEFPTPFYTELTFSLFFNLILRIGAVKRSPGVTYRLQANPVLPSGLNIFFPSTATLSFSNFFQKKTPLLSLAKNPGHAQPFCSTCLTNVMVSCYLQLELSSEKWQFFRDDSDSIADGESPLVPSGKKQRKSRPCPGNLGNNLAPNFVIFCNFFNASMRL